MAQDSIEGFRLSPQQKRIWAQQRNSATYRVQAAYRLQGQLNVARLKQAWQTVVQRHTSLRTTFQFLPGMDVPVQVIVGDVSTVWDEVELGVSTPAAQAEELKVLYEKDLTTHFNFFDGPIWHISLIALEPQAHILLLTLSALCTDAQSLNVLLHELGQAYLGTKAEEPVQYMQFSEWQHQLLESDEDADVEARTYWVKPDASAQLATQLPFETRTTTKAAFAPQSISVALEPSAVAAIRSLAERNQASTAAILLAGWAALLSKLTSSISVAIGVRGNVRDYEELQGVVGPMVKYAPMLLGFARQQSFTKLLAQTEALLTETTEWQANFFWEVAFAGMESPDLLFMPFGFDFEEASDAVNFDGVAVSLSYTYTCLDRFTARLAVAQNAGNLLAEIHYDANRLGTGAAQRMAGQFRTLLANALQRPDALIVDLEILTPDERQQLLVGFNAQTAPVQTNQFIHHWFEDQAERTPDAEALLFLPVETGAKQRLTYAELNTRANQLAHYLRSLGVGPEVRVGLCADRSLDIVIGLLAILKAGGAYVPLDPSYPAARLSYMLQDSGTSVLLSQLTGMGPFLPAPGVTVINLNTVWESLDRYPSYNPDVRLADENLAYIIYTSGSTGQPKGVLVEHHNLVHSTQARRLYYRDSVERFLLLSSFAFDSSVAGIFWTLCDGGTLVIPATGLHAELSALVNIIANHKISHLLGLPSLYSAMLAQAVAEQLSSLSAPIVAGEACPVELVEAHRDLLPGTALYNEYGPTEGTVWCTVYNCVVGEPLQPVPIGHSITNVQVYVLDAFGHPTAVGIPGELTIGGDGIVRGYLNRPDLTAERFVPSPFSSHPGARLYRTGDLARYLPDGTLEFLGRLDQQVKIRGYRVELGEIESRLQVHPAIKDVAVVALDSDKVETEKRIVAYVVTKPIADDTAVEASTELFESQYLAQWQTIYDSIYSQKQAYSQRDTSINLRAWTSSYTNRHLSEDEIIESVDEVSARVLALQPKRVLEIGVGTGLLLFRLAPRCTAFWGTDISATALGYIEEQLEARHPALNNVTLLQKPAHDFSGLAGEYFDVILINEVLQHFPDVDYLLRVLDNASQVLKPGGYIFLGGVRSLPLLNAFHASIQLGRAAPDLSITELRQRLQTSLASEKDLVVDPVFFALLPDHLSQICNVWIEVKGGQYDNEINRFQYDVILQVGGEASATTNIKWRDWQADSLSVSSLRQMLADEQPAQLGLAHIPNARVLADVKALDILATDTPPPTAGDLQTELQDTHSAGINPEVLRSLARELGYDISIRWSPDAVDCVDAVFTNQPAGRGVAAFPISRPKTTSRQFPKDYTNARWRVGNVRSLVPELRRYLRQSLPEYMIPTTFVTLPTLPLGPNGKVNRKLLPVPDRSRPELAEIFVAPRTRVESEVARIICEVLGLERVGIHDNFFDVGGHSLLATQVIARTSDAFQIELSPRRLFEAPTVAGLAEKIELILWAMEHQPTESIQVDRETGTL